MPGGSLAGTGGEPCGDGAVHEFFVGRAAEQAELSRQLELAERGQGRVVLLAGPAGIGKSALIRQCLACWASRADAVLMSGDASETRLTGGLVGQLAQPGTAAADIAAVLATGRADPLTLGSALLAFLHERAGARPLAVLVDDAQWGDELSLQALSFAVRRLRSAPVLCLIATRPEDLTRLPAGLARLITDDGVRLDLGGLAATEVGVLAELAGAGPLPSRAAARLREHTGGVPLHITELLHDLPVCELGRPGGTLPAPRSLATLVLARLAACAEETERLVVAAAVLGVDCEVADAATLAGLTDPLPALQEAVQQRILAESWGAGGGRRCVFPHALIRAAIYRDIGLSRRAELHRAAAALTGGTAALAHRAAGCPGVDPDLARDLAAQAAAEQAARQLAEAAEHLLLAVRVAGRGAQRDGWLLTAVGIMIDLADAARARGHLEQVSALPPTAHRSLLLGRLALLSGAVPTAERLVSEGWAALAREVPAATDQIRETAAQAACELGLALIGQNRLDDAAAWTHRAAGVAASEFQHACSCAVYGGSLAAAGHPRRAATLLETELRRCHDGPAQTLLRAGLGSALLYADDLPGATGHLDAAIGATGPTSLPVAHLLEARLQRVLASYRAGDWDQAEAEGGRLISLIDDLDQVRLLARAHLTAVYVAAGRGHWVAAARHVTTAASHPGAGMPAGALALAEANAAIAVAQDDPAAMLAAGQDIVSEPGLLARMAPGRLSFWPAYAEALARIGRLAAADATLTRYEQHAHRYASRSALSAASRVRGVLEAARQRPDAALAAFEASLRHGAGLGMPLAEAMTRLDRGRLLRRCGQRRSAARDLGAARALFARLRAQPFLLRCDAELCADQPPMPSPAQPPLTARQLAVAQAAAAGKTNRQIAADLYISVKTVEFHLSQILARLGVDSRAQIAAALAATPRPG